MSRPSEKIDSGSATKRRLTALLVVGIAIVAGSWLTWFASAPPGSAGAREYEFPPLWGLAHESRTDLAICVSAAPGVAVTAADAAARISDSAADLRRTEREGWALGRIGNADPRVDAGCPVAIAMPAPSERFDVLSQGGNVFGRGEVDVPLPYRVVVLVMPSEVRADLIPEFPFGKTAYELVCERNALESDCREVTTALYVPESILSEPARLTDAVGWALGILDLRDERQAALEAADEARGTVGTSQSSK